MRFDLYYIKNNINGKIYVGQTTCGIAKRWGQHKAAAKDKQAKLYNAMRKYGVRNFSIHGICRCKNMDELNQAEEFLILQLNAQRDGYNILAGGKNFDRPVDTVKLAARVSALLTAQPTPEISIRKFKVLIILIKLLLLMPDAPDNGETCEMSEDDRRAVKKLKNMLFHGWPGERVSALYVVFLCLCVQKGIIYG